MALLQKLKSILGLGGGEPDRRERDVGVTVEREAGRAEGREAPPPMSAGRDDDETDAPSADEGDADAAVEPETKADAAIEEAEPGRTEPGDESADEPEGTSAEPAGSGVDEPDGDVREHDDAAAAGTDASGSSETISEVPDDPAEAAEPAEAVGPTGEDAAPETEKTTEPGEPVDEDASDVDAEAVVEEEADESEAVGEAAADAPDEPESVDVIKGIGPAYADRLADAGVEYVHELAAADAEELAAETDISATRIEGWIERAAVR